jgi:propionyl-CoA synthetase
MNHIFCGKPGETMFTTSDIGWVVGHSYIIYGPLLNGMATIMYEGTPLSPDAGIWWKLVEKYKVSVMFSAPTAVRVLKKQDPAFLTKYDLSTLRALFLAGEPLDEPTASWIHDVDNYWQTETGWPMLAIQRGVEVMPHKFGSPGVPSFGYNMKLLDDATSEELGSDKKGVIAIEGPLPPGCMQTVWGDDKRFVSTYWETIPGKTIYSTFDWGIKDDDGYFFILGRTDDVINVAGHRLGTREIEESISGHSNVSEVAVVGIEDKLKGQAAIAFVIPKDSSNTATLEAECMKTVDSTLGAIARPGRVYIVTALPKTRSGKIVRRALQAVAEGRDPGDISTMEDQTVLAQIKTIIEQSAKS